MKTLIIIFLMSVISLAQVHVNGYFRKDGTYVQPHYRSSPDGNFNNNWSTKGNINPYTGRVGTKTKPPSIETYTNSGNLPPDILIKVKRMIYSESNNSPNPPKRLPGLWDSPATENFYPKSPVTSYSTSSLQRKMNIDIWWSIPTKKFNKCEHPCIFLSPSVFSYDPEFALVALLTLSFDRDAGITLNDVRFLNEIAKNIGDSLGAHVIVPSSKTEYAAQYGKSTGILADIRYECYADRILNFSPAIYDTTDNNPSK